MQEFTAPRCLNFESNPRFRRLLTTGERLKGVWDTSFARSWRRAFTAGYVLHHSESIQRPWITDEWQQLCQNVDELRSIVPNPEIGRDVSLHLRFASAERNQHAEGQQLSRRDVETAARQVVAETVGREHPLDVLLISRRAGVELGDDFIADDQFLDRQALFEAHLRCGGGLARQRQLDAATCEDFICGVKEVEDLGDADVRHSLVQDFPWLPRPSRPHSAHRRVWPGIHSRPARR